MNERTKLLITFQLSGHYLSSWWPSYRDISCDLIAVQFQFVLYLIRFDSSRRRRHVYAHVSKIIDLTLDFLLKGFIIIIIKIDLLSNCSFNRILASLKAENNPINELFLRSCLFDTKSGLDLNKLSNKTIPIINTPYITLLTIRNVIMSQSLEWIMNLTEIPSFSFTVLKTQALFQCF